MKLQHFLKHSNTKLFTTAGVIVVALFMVLQSSEPHRAELRFTEKSDSPNILGHMLPASCESSGTTNASGHVTACSWSNYCTGPYDSNGNFWQNWRVNNEVPAAYENLGTSCFPDINTAID